MDVRRLCVVICAGGLVLGSAACGGAIRDGHGHGDQRTAVANGAGGRA